MINLVASYLLNNCLYYKCNICQLRLIRYYVNCSVHTKKVTNRFINVTFKYYCQNVL